MSEMEGEMAAPRVFPSKFPLTHIHERVRTYRVSVYDPLVAHECDWFKHVVSNQLGLTWNHAHTRRDLCDIGDPLLLQQQWPNP